MVESEWESCKSKEEHEIGLNFAHSEEDSDLRFELPEIDCISGLFIGNLFDELVFSLCEGFGLEFVQEFINLR